MILLGIVLALLGYFISVPLLLWLGVVLIVVGVVLNFVPLGGSRRRVF